MTIHTILSSTSSEEEELVGIPHHFNWLTFARTPTDQLVSPRVLTYINIHISWLCFSLQNDIFNHRDVSYAFFNQRSTFFLINIYSDSSQLALRYLKDTETNIHNVIIMTGDFNIRDNLWDSNFPFHSIHSDILFDIADSFSLAISKPTENFPIRFSDNDQNSNSVLDLIFLWSSSLEFNHHHIHPEWRLSSDYTPITINIPIRDESISTKRWSLIKESDEENRFIEDLIQFIKNLNITSIYDAESLEEIIWHLAIKIEDIWFKHSKMVNITKHSKAVIRQ